MNNFDKARRAADIKRAIRRATKLQDLIEALETLRRFDLAYARTHRNEHLLNLLEAQHVASKLIEEVLGCDLTDYRENIKYEAWRECHYDIENGTFVDENGEPVRD
jgi:DNA-binding ferritin-like protein (Dps family)